MIKMTKIDGHIHSPYCPHGTKDPFEKYIEQAIQLGYTQITFTEHAPLPKGFVDTTPTMDSGMTRESLDLYLSDLKELQNRYSHKINILIGLEVDFIEGYEKETTDFLNTYGMVLDDSILSVHFLHNKNSWDCLDYSHEYFNRMLETYGSVDLIYDKYYDTVKKSILAELGNYKPKRIGHMTLVRKFQKLHKPTHSYEQETNDILKLIKEHDLQLDYNGAGLLKPYCQETYPSEDIIKKAKALNIPIIYGSDAHQAKDLNQGREKMLL